MCMNSYAHIWTTCVVAYWGLRRVSDPLCGWSYKWDMNTGNQTPVPHKSSKHSHPPRHLSKWSWLGNQYAAKKQWASSCPSCPFCPAKRAGCPLTPQRCCATCCSAWFLPPLWLSSCLFICVGFHCCVPPHHLTPSVCLHHYRWECSAFLLHWGHYTWWQVLLWVFLSVSLSRQMYTLLLGI